MNERRVWSHRLCASDRVELSEKTRRRSGQCSGDREQAVGARVGCARGAWPDWEQPRIWRFGDACAQGGRQVETRFFGKLCGALPDGADPSGPGIVGGEQPRIAEALVEQSEIGCPGHDIVVRVVRIESEAITLSHVAPCAGHELHETDRAGSAADRFAVQAGCTAALEPDDASDPICRDRKASRGFRDDRHPAVHGIAGCRWWGGGSEGRRQRPDQERHSNITRPSTSWRGLGPK